MPVAVITGASAGVGRATANALAARGYDVGLIARGAAGLAGAAKDVESHGTRALVAAADVSDFAAVDRAATLIEDGLGPIDVWINDAMTTVFAWSWDCRPDEFKRAVEVTFLGQVHGTLAALSRMRPRDRGRIVNVGSALAFVGIPLQSAYCASKFACRGFYESVRAELIASGSKVSIAMVHLPAVNTPQFDWCLSKLPNHPQPVPPIYQPERCAKLIARVAEEGRVSKVIGAFNKCVVAGAKLFPSALAYYAGHTAVSSQQTADPVDPNRRVNLWSPVDEDDDHGARGGFDRVAGGSLDPSFLRNLPDTLRAFASSMQEAVAEKTHSF